MKQTSWCFNSIFKREKKKTFFLLCIGDAVLKPQWKAAIDFKWIRDNKDAVAANIRNRNSNANLELVIELYEKMSNLQKVIIIFIS